MTTEQMVQAEQQTATAPPTNGAAAKQAATAMAKEGTPQPPGAAPTADGVPATENGTPTPPEPTPEAKEAAEERKREDELVAKGAEIAGVRALLARAFSRASEEPARPKTHWAFLLEEMAWLAVDFNQERLWRRTAALAVAFEIAKKKGDFGLKQPPTEWRVYSEEVRALRAAAAAAGGGGSGGQKTPSSATHGRRSSAREAAKAAAAAAASAEVSPATLLALDSAEDPIFADLEAASEADGLMAPGTPPLESLAAALAFPCEDEFAVTLESCLMASNVDRLIKEEMAVRAYQLEHEAALMSHQLAVAEQQAAANNIGDLGLGPAIVAGPDDGLDAFGTGKKSAKRRKGGARGASSAGGFLGLDDFAEEEEGFGVGGAAAGAAGGPKRSSSRAALVEDVYLRKRRPTRTPAYREQDADYDLAADTGGNRYATRRTTGALARNQGRGGVGERARRGGPGSRADAYQQQQAARARAQAGLPGMMLWSKAEDDLLLAVVHEFGINWTLVSEVLSLSLGMQGIYRPQQQCRQRFRQLTMQEGQDYSEERAFATLSQQLSKQQARELLVASLPVRDDALVRLLEALVQVGATAKGKRAAEEKRNEGLRTRQQEPHPSYITIFTALMQQTGRRHLSPLDLSAHVNNTYLAQARQQQMMAAQQQMMQQMQSQQGQQQAAAAAAAAAQQQQHQQLLPGQPGAMPAQQQMQMPSGANGAAGGPPPGTGGIPPLGGQQQHEQQQQQPQPQQQPPQQQQQQPPIVHGTPTGQGPLAMPPPGSGSGPQPPMQAPAPPKPGQHPPPQITLQQLNTILANNKLPGGQALSEEMRNAIENKRTAFLAQMQAQQAAVAQRQQQQQVMGMAGGMPGQQQQPGMVGTPGSQPGLPPPNSAGALAALQAAQQQQQQQQRPPMPQGMQGAVYAVPPGAGGLAMQGAAGQPMALPPGMSVMSQGGPMMGAQLAAGGVNGGMTLQGLQPGMLPPGTQQQLLAQQMMHQQQAAAAAAAAVAAAAAQQQAK